MRIENRKILLSFLYGSQNYGLNNPDSDRDFVTVYMPSRDDVYYGQSDMSYKGDEHNTMISLPKFMRYVLKGNANYWECIFSTAISTYTAGAQRLLYFLQDNSRPLLQYSANGFLNSLRGKAFGSDLSQPKHLARAWYFALLANNMVNNDMAMDFASWRNTTLCTKPYLIRYEGCNDVTREDVMNMFDRVFSVPHDYEENAAVNEAVMREATRRAQELFYDEVRNY